MIKYLLYIFVVSQFVCCQSGSNKTLSGFEYTLLHTKGNKPPQKGDYIYYYLSTYISDTLVTTSRDKNIPQVYKMPHDSVLMASQSPYLEVLKYLGPGDSAMVTQSLIGIKRLPPEFGNATSVTFGVYVENVLSEEAYQMDLKKQRANVQEEKDLYSSKMIQAATIMETFFDQPENDRFGSFTTTPSGLKYKIIKKGTETIFAKDGKHMIDLSYYGCLSNGEMFETSYKYGIPFRFVKGSGNIMPGWNEMVSYLSPAAQAIVYVPSDLAYGEQGFKGNVKIPPNEDLYFYLEIENIIPVRKF